MTTPTQYPVTELLAAVGRGDGSARDKLWSLIYDELRGMARHQLADEARGRAMQPTSLVHEVYLRLTAGQEVQWADRRHFFAAAARAMRRIRIDDARKRNRLKRGGGAKPGRLDDESVPHTQREWGTRQDPTEELAIDEALDRLEQTNSRMAEVVMQRYFAGLTVDETADVLGVSSGTVDTDWRFARAWLRRELT